MIQNKIRNISPKTSSKTASKSESTDQTSAHRVTHSDGQLADRNGAHSAKAMPGIAVTRSQSSSPFESVKGEEPKDASAGGDVANDAAGDVVSDMVGDAANDANGRADEEHVSVSGGASSLESKMASIDLNAKEPQTKSAANSRESNGSQVEVGDSRRNSHPHHNYRRNYNYNHNNTNYGSTNKYHKRNNYSHYGNNSGNNRTFINRTYYNKWNDRNSSNDQNRNFNSQKGKPFSSSYPTVSGGECVPTGSVPPRAVQYSCPPCDYYQPIAYYVPNQTFTHIPVTGYPMVQSMATNSLCDTTYQPSLEESKKVDESNQNVESRNDLMALNNGNESSMNAANFVPIQSSAYFPVFFGYIQEFGYNENGFPNYFYVITNPPNLAPYQLGIDMNGTPILPPNCLLI